METVVAESLLSRPAVLATLTQPTIEFTGSAGANAEDEIVVDCLVAIVVFFFCLLGVAYDLRSNPYRFKLNYRLRRTFNWLLMGSAYAFQVQARYSLYAMNTASSLQFLGLTTGSYGTLATVGLLTYAVGMLVNGPFVDRFGARTTFSYALLLHSAVMLVTGLICQIFKESPHVIGPLMFPCYGLNCFCQTFGALCPMKINARWYPKDEIGTIGGVFGIMLGVGYMLAFGGNGILVSKFHLWSVFYTIAGCLFLCFVLCTLFLVEKTPQQLYASSSSSSFMLEAPSSSSSLLGGTTWENQEREAKDEEEDGLHPHRQPEEQQQAREGAGDSKPTETTLLVVSKAIEKTNTNGLALGTFPDQTEADQQQNGRGREPVRVKRPSRRIRFDLNLWLCGLVMLCVGAVREGFFAWVTTYLDHTLGVPPGSLFQEIVASSVTVRLSSLHLLTHTLLSLSPDPHLVKSVSWLLVGAVVGAFLASWGCNKFKRNRAMFGVIVYLGVVVVFILFLVLPVHIYTTIFVSFAASIGFFAIQGLRRVLAIDLGGIRFAASVTGLLGTFQFIGGSLCGVGLGALISEGGYIWWQASQLLFSALGLCLCISLSLRSSRKSAVNGPG